LLNGAEGSRHIQYRELKTAMQVSLGSHLKGLDAACGRPIPFSDTR
jgi:hypothetical protein